MAAVSLAQIDETQVAASAAKAQTDSRLAAEFCAESELIIECSRVKLCSEELERVSELLRKVLSWDYIFTTAYRNGVLPLISWNLLQNFKDELPAEIKKQIAENFQQHGQNNLLLTLKLIEIVKLLETAGIPALPFKGPTLAMRGYGNLAFRQFVDLDVLIQPKHFERAIEILSANNYQPINNSKWQKMTAIFFTRKKDVSLRGDERTRIELHWKLSGAHFSLPFEVAQLWTRLEKIKLGGAELNTLSFKDLFIYLCLHGARHGFERLSWICDLNELIRTEEESGRAIDWTAIRSHAKTHGCEKVVELGIFLVREFFGTSGDYPEIEKLENDKVFQEISAQIRQRLFSENRSQMQIGDWYLYHLLLKEKKTDRAKLHLHYLSWYLRLAFRPNLMDEAVFRLPSAFYPLYYVLRPLRLLSNRFNFNSAKK